MQRNTIKFSKLFQKPKYESGFYNPSFFDRRFGAQGLLKKDYGELPTA